MTEPQHAPPPAKRGQPVKDGYLFVIAVRVPTEADAEKIKQLTAANRGAALLEYLERKDESK